MSYDAHDAACDTALYTADLHDACPDCLADLIPSGDACTMPGHCAEVWASGQTAGLCETCHEALREPAS